MTTRYEKVDPQNPNDDRVRITIDTTLESIVEGINYKQTLRERVQKINQRISALQDRRQDLISEINELLNLVPDE